MFRSIKWRLTALFFTVTAIILFLLGLYLMNSMGQYSYGNIQTRLLSNARLMGENLKGPLIKPSKPDFFQEYARSIDDKINARITIIDGSGQVLGDSVSAAKPERNIADLPEIRKALSGETGKSVRAGEGYEERWFYLADPVKSDDKVIGAVRVAIPWSDIEAGRSQIRLSIGTAVLVALILMVMVVASFASELADSLQQMTRAAHEMAEGKLDQTLRLGTDDEIGSLSTGLNYMAQRLRDTIAQITEERNKVKAILTSMSDGVIAVDRNGSILLINPAVERTFNIKYEQIVGKSLIEVIRNYDLDKLVHKALTSPEIFNQEVQIFAPDPKTFRVSLAPLTNEAGVVGVVAVLRDITAFREVERMKTDFVANVSHELKTPLTSIKGFVETLLDGALENPGTARHFLEIINDEAERLNRLIIDLLSLSRIEAKQPEVHKALLNMEKLISGAVSILLPQARNKNLSLNVDLKYPLPVIEADEDMIGQLMINLIDNAIKYTSEGGRIDIRAEAAEEGVSVSVSDTGIGIPADSIARLFERFYRVDKARSRAMGGTGLGLAIVKHILEVHNGHIDVQSELGQGSTFTFYLPATAYK